MARTGLSDYEAFVTLARLRSFRATARELGVAPSALSTAIAGLEERLGVRLFNRTTRSVALTEVGAQFAEQIAPALTQIDAAVEAINGHRQTPAGVLRINTNTLALRQVIGPLVADYLRRFPQMRLDIVTDSSFVDIVAGGYDAGIRLAEGVPKDMIAVSIESQERLLVVASPDYLKCYSLPLTPEDLAGHQCILGRIGNRVISQWEFERDGKRIPIKVSGPLTLDDPSAMVEAALAGIGLGNVPEILAAEYLATGRLVAVLEDWTPPYPGISLYYPGRRHVPAGLQAFIEIIRSRRRLEMRKDGNESSPRHR